MHTYIKAKMPDGSPGWQAGYATTGPTAEHSVSPLGPVFETEPEAAAFVSFLNGGSYSPGEMTDVLPPPEADPEIEAEAARAERRAAEKANRPKGMDYPPEDERNPNPPPGGKPKQQPAHPARQKHAVKRLVPKKGKRR